MGAIGLRVPLSAPARDGEKLLRAVWDAVRAYLSQGVKKKAGRDVTGGYLSIISYDALDDGNWFAMPGELHFAFTDSAGLCYMEQYVCHHWFTLALLDLWPELEKLAREHGGVLGDPQEILAASDRGPEALARLLGPGRDEVFFEIERKMAWADRKENPQVGDVLSFMGGSKPLGKLKPAERERISGLIRQGLCGCELCQKLRGKLGLPLAPEPAKPEKKAASAAPRKVKAIAPVAAALELKDAQVVTIGHPKQIPDLDLATLVAVDLESAGQSKIPQGILSKLPGFPLRALNLKRRGMFNLPPEVLECRDLEVLGLQQTFSSARASLTERLPELSRLRGIDLGMCTWKRPAPRAALDVLARIPTLEVLDGFIDSPELPDAFADLRSLRQVYAGHMPNVGVLDGLPLEALVTSGAVLPKLTKPLRYFRGPLATLGDGVEAVEFLTLGDGPLPEVLKSAHSLVGLQFSNAASLPEWLVELPNLRHLQFTNYGLPFDPKNLGVLGRLERLESLLMRVTVEYRHPPAMAELDLGGLTSLKWLSLTEWGYNCGVETLPKGIDKLGALRVMVVGGSPPEMADRLPAGVEVIRSNNWDNLDTFRAVTATRDTPEWWLSRFGVANGDNWERFAQLVGPS